MQTKTPPPRARVNPLFPDKWHASLQSFPARSPERKKRRQPPPLVLGAGSNWLGRRLCHAKRRERLPGIIHVVRQPGCNVSLGVKHSDMIACRQKKGRPTRADDPSAQHGNGIAHFAVSVHLFVTVFLEYLSELLIRAVSLGRLSGLSRWIACPGDLPEIFA